METLGNEREKSRKHSCERLRTPLYALVSTAPTPIGVAEPRFGTIGHADWSRPNKGWIVRQAMTVEARSGG